uniref:phospholipase A2 n=2 Tax=Latimeria chalumnae TaxID=7897 RepID=H3A0T4_LATCH
YQVSDGDELATLHQDLQGNLVGCSIIGDQREVNSFMHICRLGLKGQKQDFSGLSWGGSSSGLDQAKGDCLAFLEAQRLEQGSKTLQAGRSTSKGPQNSLHRSKRGFTYPGTLWCGVGNNADDYEHLGKFKDTDSCCREHDHCPHVIHPFTYKYGYRNFKWHTISHCDCDTRLKRCLRTVNDTSSRVVGQAFFNVIQVPCFEFHYQEQCVERYWYGWCKKYGLLPIAVAREVIPYDFGGDLIDYFTIAPPTNKQLSSTVTTDKPIIDQIINATEDLLKVMATIGQSSTTTTTMTSKTDSSIDGLKKRKNKKKDKKKKTKD